MDDHRPHLDARWFIHFTLTAIMAGIALQLIAPGDTFAGISWKVISKHVSEGQLAVLCWGVACVGVVGLVTPHRGLRLAAVAFLSIAHAIMAAAFLWANPAGIGSLLLGGYAIQGFYLTYRRFSGGP